MPSVTAALLLVVFMLAAAACACGGCVMGARVDRSTPVMSLEGCVEARGRLVEVNLALADLELEERRSRAAGRA